MVLGYATDVWNWVDSLWSDTIQPTLNGLIHSLDSVWAWVDYIVAWYLNWIDTVRYYVDFYVSLHINLTAFLADPLGWVLGQQLNIFRWWFALLASYGEALHHFLTVDMTDVINFWSAWRVRLWDFFENPVDWILNRLAPAVVDWLAGVLADEW